jgi:bacillithiol synthase
LFGHEGVVVLDADDISLKAEFSQIIEDDLMNHHANDLVEQTNAKLTSLGYAAQIFPRAINFFYLHGDVRERITKAVSTDKQESDAWKVLNTDLSFSEEELKSLIQNEPEKFSPNVVMRPLYQEVILPNLAYVGGPAEVVYWMQLKTVFEYYHVPFPILMPRNFGLVISKPVLKKMDKFGYVSEDVFKKGEELKSDYLAKTGSENLNFSEEKDELQRLFEKLTAKALEVDGSLKGFIGAEFNKSQKSLDTIEKRLKKAEEQKHELALNQIIALKEKLFPNGNPQERHDNFLNFYLNNHEFVNELIESFDPFDYRMHVITEE